MRQQMLKRKRIETYMCYRRMVRWLLGVVGLWPTKQSDWWYRLLPYAQLVLSTVTVMAIVNYIAHHIKNIKIVINVIGLLTSTTLYMLKLFMMTINRKEVAVIHKKLNDFSNEIMEDNRLIEPACRRVDRCFHLSWTFTASVWGSFFMILVILPFINMMMQVIKDPANVKYALIYPTLYPWNTTSDGILYRITYLLETLTAFSCCNATSGIDSLILFYIFQVISQLRAMSYRLNHIREGENYDEIMRTCAMHYVTIIKCRDELQRIYGPIILYNVGSCAALLCTLMYQLCQATSLTKIQMSRVAVYIIAKSLQVYLYTWSGTLLYEESEKYLRNVYSSNWVGTRSTRAVLITISQKPLIIKACHLLVVSVELFAKTMNTTISYFLLLRTIA